MKRFFAWILAFALLLCGVSAGAEEPGQKTNRDGFVYTVQEDGTAKIVKYTGTEKKVKIPAKLDGCPVTVIGSFAFDTMAVRNTLQSVTFPDTVLRIERSAFENCAELTDAPLPKKLEFLGGGAFWRCKKLKNAGTLPDTLTEVEYNPFAGCDALKSVKVSKKHPYLEMKNGALFSKPDSRLIWYPIAAKAQAYTVPDGTKIIGEMAFEFTKVTKVTLPESVEEFGVSAFGYCPGLTEINVPSRVENLNAFTKGCGELKSIRVSPDNPWFRSEDGVLFNADATVLLIYPAGRDAASYTVPEGVTEISTNAFEKARFTSVRLPDSLQVIGSSAFGSSNLIRVSLPEGVTKLAGYAFQSCSGLEEAELPRSLDLNWSVFNGCRSLRSVVIDADHPYLALEDNCLYNRGSGKLIWYNATDERECVTLPAGIRIIGEACMANRQILELIIPEGVEKIEARPFSNSFSLTRIHIPASVTEISDQALARTVYTGNETIVYVVPAGSYAEEFCRLYELTYETEP